MVDERRREGAPADATADGAPAAHGRSFLVRYRLPLALAAIALCGYVGSIVYIVYVRGQLG